MVIRALSRTALLLSARLVLFLGDPPVVGVRMLPLDATQPLGANRMRDQRLQPVVRLRLLNRLESNRTLLRRARAWRVEPQRRVDDDRARERALNLEGKRYPLAVL